jgi:phosphoenolpyruvate synthase/pyruvate phosphate dikinase
VVADFSQENFDRYSNFVRIGEGSLGGKGRGLAFLDHVLKRHPEMNEMGDVRVMVPRTVVVCTDVFDYFMEDNNLFEIALSDVSDEEIVQQFLKGRFREDVHKNLSCYLNAIQGPVAIRSSSLLEDAHYQPFAGIYATYMIPYREDKKDMLRLLLNAIKAVYASVYRRDSKAYIEATSNVIDEEKMAVVLQEVAGVHHDNLFYPDVSGVLRSLNSIPWVTRRWKRGL